MNLNLLVPLSVPREHGFFQTLWDETHRVGGHKVRLTVSKRYHYLEFEDVTAGQAPQLVELVETLLPWASVKLGFSVKLEDRRLNPEIQRCLIFNGNAPVLYESSNGASPYRSAGSHSSQDGDVHILRALEQGDALPGITGNSDPEFKIACELFTAVDFESSVNAQFITLTSILEILSRPQKRAAVCVQVIDDMIQHAKALSATATGDLKDALKSLNQSAGFWKKESFSGAIKTMAKRVAAAFGDPDVEQAGKRAVKLYGRRSGIVHRGESASLEELDELRQLVRETIAMEAGAIEGIRAKPTAGREQDP